MNLNTYLDQMFLFSKIGGRSAFLDKMYVETTKRGNILVVTISAIELFFIARLLVLYGLPQNMPVLERHYFYAYCSLILVMGLVWFASAHILGRPAYSYRFKRYATLLVCQGTVLPLIYISWLDQYTYGQVSVYFCALICVALYPLLEPLWSFVFLMLNQIIFSAGIVVYQPDPLVASAHILNTIPFVIFMWLISRQFFKNKIHEYEDAHTIKLQRDELYQLYSEESLSDDLTRIGNRRYLRKSFEAYRKNCIHSKLPLTLMFIDGDNLKSINDSFGHNSGDSFLKVIAEALEAYSKSPSTAIGRLGGDEFVLLSEGMTHESARKTGEEIREYVVTHTCFEDGSSGSVSIGFIVLAHGEILDFKSVLAQADSLMYTAKQSGKNQVVSL